MSFCEQHHHDIARVGSTPWQTICRTYLAALSHCAVEARGTRLWASGRAKPTVCAMPRQWRTFLVVASVREHGSEAAGAVLHLLALHQQGVVERLPDGQPARALPAHTVAKRVLPLTQRAVYVRVPRHGLQHLVWHCEKAEGALARHWAHQCAHAGHPVAERPQRLRARGACAPPAHHAPTGRACA